ncbi:uncharacterized protein LOC121530244 [Drosophila eugracilis]|uniref:uncharacterized protein LOC121530244 n=1 Tax=Drosophila eugracilis TaxID=29029 RepID=UPI001BD9B333|nr:uncharacterized protein LOC121530244 [Drosophila eugracilis]
MERQQVIYLSILWLNNLCITNGAYKFNSLTCEVVPPESINNYVCHIKAIDRKHNMLSIASYALKNVSEIGIHFKMVKREIGGWHPFLYDMKLDLCEFFKNRRKFFIPNFIYSFMKSFTNINHTCPYLAGADLGLWNWTPDEAGILSKFPVEHGQYGLHTTWYINKKLAFKMNGSVLFF